MAQPTNIPAPSRRRRLTAGLAQLGPLYTVFGYRRTDRLLKDTLAAATSTQAIGLGRTILRKRGVALDGIKFIALRVSPQAIAKAFHPSPSPMTGAPQSRP